MFVALYALVYCGSLKTFPGVCVPGNNKRMKTTNASDLSSQSSSSTVRWQC